MNTPKTEPGSCPHNCGINCDKVSEKCNYCGWNPKVSDRRIATIRAGRLSTHPDGLKYLDVSKFQRERTNADAV